MQRGRAIYVYGGDISPVTEVSGLQQQEQVTHKLPARSAWRQHTASTQATSSAAPCARLSHGRPGRAQESAELLLEPKHENTAPWFQIYWDSLPARDEFLWRRQPFPTDKLALLQDEALVGPPFTFRQAGSRAGRPQRARPSFGATAKHLQSRV